jgi:hypothetical protein
VSDNWWDVSRRSRLSSPVLQQASGKSPDTKSQTGTFYLFSMDVTQLAALTPVITSLTAGLK